MVHSKRIFLRGTFVLLLLSFFFPTKAEAAKVMIVNNLSMSNEMLIGVIIVLVIVLIVVLKMYSTKIKNTKKEISRQKKEVYKSYLYKSSFLENLNHEIRTPLNTIVGFSSMLVSDDVTKEEKDEYAVIIDANTKQLVKLIENIIVLLKLESGHEVLENDAFDLSNLMNSIYENMKTYKRNSEVNFLFDNPYDNCIVFFDKSRLAQVVNNFLTNAFVATKTGYVRLSYKKEKNGVTISVVDTGIGIDEADKDKIFHTMERFNKFEGTGLGLSIGKAIVEAGGGKIGFDSTKDVGSEFWLWIPNG